MNPEKVKRFIERARAIGFVNAGPCACGSALGSFLPYNKSCNCETRENLIAALIVLRILED